MRSFGDVGMPTMYTFDSAVLRAHIYLYRLYLAMKNLTCIKWWFFLTVLNQVDTLKYDYISHYFVLRYTLTSVLTLYDHDGAVFSLWFKQTCSLLYKITEGGCRHTFSKKLLHYHKEIHFSMPNRFLFLFKECKNESMHLEYKKISRNIGKWYYLFGTNSLMNS